MQRLVSLIDQHGEELNLLQTLENGMPVAFSSLAVVSSAMAAAIFDHHAGWIDKICGSTYPSYDAAPTGGRGPDDELPRAGGGGRPR